MEKKQCRGLIIQNNPFSYNTGNGKTIASMFSEWDSENLAQIFTSNLQPDFSICKNYFKMSDGAAVKSFFKRIPFGQEILQGEDNSIKCMNDDDGRALLKNHGKRLRCWMSESSFVIVLRDLIWQKSKWENNFFIKWLDKVQPQFVFLSAGNLSVFYDMALFICERYEIPLFVHIGDDYFIYRNGLNPWKNLHRRKMSKKLGQVIARSKCVIAICDKMAQLFKERYGGEYFICMNSVEIQTEVRCKEKEPQQDIKLVYAGNLGINRWKILNLIGQALAELQQEGIHAKLDIYSSYTPGKRILRKLTIPSVMQFCGSVFGEELKRVKRDADILVHVEAFDKKYRQLTYTAMSTKISEYLAAGKTILAVGPEEAASIEFLWKNNVAMVVTECSRHAIKEQLTHYVSTPEELKDMSYRALQIAKEKFSREINAKKIYKIISES